MPFRYYSITLFFSSLVSFLSLSAAIAEQSDPVNLKKEPVNQAVNWLGALRTAPSTANNGDAYHNTADGNSYILINGSWQVLLEVSIAHQDPQSASGAIKSEAPSGVKMQGNHYGDMLFWNNYEWVIVPAGNPGQFLSLSEDGTPYWREVVQTVKDIDGNVYNTVQIGEQVWMVENLKVTRFNDGMPIQLVSDYTAWGSLSTHGYCWYNNDKTTYKKLYGALYNWYAVETGKLAPTGWHVATNDDWMELKNYLIANGFNYDCTTTGNKIAKSLAAKTNWRISTNRGVPGNDMCRNNSSGFSAFPGCYRIEDGTFSVIGYYDCWWSTTEYAAHSAWQWDLFYDKSYFTHKCSSKNSGLNIRCVKDK